MICKCQSCGHVFSRDTAQKVRYIGGETEYFCPVCGSDDYEEIKQKGGSKMSVYEKMLNVMAKVSYLNKDGFVETTKGKGYKALTDEKVLTTIRPILVEEKLVMVPVKMTQRRTDEKITVYNNNQPVEKTNRVTDVEMTFRIVDAENPSDFVEVVSCGTGVDTQDKGIGKAQTYAKKYAILNSFLVPSGDDTDQISSEKYDEQLFGKAQDTQPKPEEQLKPEIPQKSDRKINIKTCIELAKQKGATALISEDGYRGKAWDTLTDEEIIKVKLWIASAKKK